MIQVLHFCFSAAILQSLAFISLLLEASAWNAKFAIHCWNSIYFTWTTSAIKTRLENYLSESTQKDTLRHAMLNYHGKKKKKEKKHNKMQKTFCDFHNASCLSA